MKRLLSIISLFITTICFSQQKTLTGVVVNKKTNTALSGASVSAKNKTVITDANGNFSIEASVGDNLSVSYIGLKAVTFKIGNQQNLSIELDEGTSTLDDVVVTGYQTQRKADLTGAVSVVNMKDVKDIPSGNPMQALQGRVPGLYIEADGSPSGSNRRVLIRGLNTLGDNSPLYIIDGVPTKRPEVFQNLNPNSIQSIQVLKDASAGINLWCKGIQWSCDSNNKRGKRKREIAIAI